MLNLPQLLCLGSCYSCLLDQASLCKLCGKAALIGLLGADVILAEISWTRQIGYAETSFCPTIGLLSTLCRAYVVPTGQYGLFCNARYLKLQRNSVLGMVERLSGWLGLQQGWQEYPTILFIANFVVVAVELGISNNLVIFRYFALAIRLIKAAFLPLAEGDKV